MKFILLILVAFAASTLAWTQCQIDILNRHNNYRDRHGVPRLTLDATISNWAQEWANRLASTNSFYHRPNNKYGENLYRSSGAANCIAVIDAFYNEIKFYSYSRPGFSSQTGHFTQLVWKSSRRIGVGVARDSRGGTYVVVNYDPPGNYLGQFPQNVLPPLY